MRARDACPGCLNSFIFIQFSVKKLVSVPTLGVGGPTQENPGSTTGHVALMTGFDLTMTLIGWDKKRLFFVCILFYHKAMPIMAVNCSFMSADTKSSLIPTT